MHIHVRVYDTVDMTAPVGTDIAPHADQGNTASTRVDQYTHHCVEFFSKDYK